MAFVAQTIPESKAAAQGTTTIYEIVMPSLHAIKF